MSFRLSSRLESRNIRVIYQREIGLRRTDGTWLTCTDKLLEGLLHMTSTEGRRGRKLACDQYFWYFRDLAEETSIMTNELLHKCLNSYVVIVSLLGSFLALNRILQDFTYTGRFLCSTLYRNVKKE